MKYVKYKILISINIIFNLNKFVKGHNLKKNIFLEFIFLNDFKYFIFIIL
jgi:hypothetical protein